MIFIGACGRSVVSTGTSQLRFGPHCQGTLSISILKHSHPLHMSIAFWAWHCVSGPFWPRHVVALRRFVREGSLPSATAPGVTGAAPASPAPLLVAAPLVLACVVCCQQVIAFARTRKA